MSKKEFMSYLFDLWIELDTLKFTELIDYVYAHAIKRYGKEQLQHITDKQLSELIEDLTLEFYSRKED